jgi:hypothetical protein
MPVGTAAAILGSAVIGGAVSASSASKASKAQTRAAQQAADVQRQQYEQTRQDLAPYRDAGSTALGNYQSLLGLSGEDAYTRALQGYRQSPFLAQLVQNTGTAVDASRAARGGLFSGATAQEIGDRTGQLYMGDFNNYLSRLGGLADTGQNAAAQTGSAGANAAAGMSNAYTAAGQARADGYINTANSVNNALSQGAQLYGAYKGGYFDKPAAPPPAGQPPYYLRPGPY